MSLYVYVVPVTEEQADAYEAWLTHARSQGIFSSHSCWRSECYPKMPNLYEDSLALGRPMCNDGADEAENWYGKQVIGENEFTKWLGRTLSVYAGTPEGPDADWREWLFKHFGQTVVVGNDNEWSS